MYFVTLQVRNVTLDVLQGSKIPLTLSPNANEKFALARIKFQQVDIWRIKLHKFQL